MSARRQTFWDDLAEFFEIFPWWVPVASGLVAGGGVYLAVTFGAPRLIAAVVPGREVSSAPTPFTSRGPVADR